MRQSRRYLSIRKPAPETFKAESFYGDFVYAAKHLTSDRNGINMKKIKEIEKPIIFEENQRINQFWLWLLMVSLAGFSFYAFISQIVLGKKVGNSPMSDPMLILSVLLSGVLLPIFFFVTELRTRVTEDGLYVKYFPIHRKWLFFSTVESESFKKTRYRPILEYGGWGIRIRFNKKAYSISGNMGMKLTLPNGKSLLVGTQKPDEFESAIQKIKKT